MLLEFRCDNFRSFKNEVCLSMLPIAAYKEHSKNLINANPVGSKTAGVLSSAVIYGANASGKTNLLRAIAFAQGITLGNIKVGTEELRESFIGESARPSTFSFSILIEGIGYVYEFSFDRRGLTHEILKTQPKSERLVFERTRLDDSSYSIKQGSRYSGISSRLKGYNDNGPVLGLLAKFGINDCKTVYSWIQDKLVVADYSRNIDEIIIIEKLKALDSQGFSKAIDAVRAADLGIAGAQLVVTDLTAEERENQKVVAEQFKKIYELLTGEQVEEFSPDLTKTTLQFQHVIAGAKRGLGLKDESLGTVTMLNLAIDFIDAVANGKTLVIDEADRSLHPVLLRSLLRLFCDCDSNPLGAQLVLTTHDLLIMDGDLLRRDQFWFVQKSAESGASELYPLSDYSPRKDDNLLNRYLYGAYGAVPYIEEVF